MAELAGQLALFDTQSFPTMLDAEAYEVAYCPACHSNWGAENARAKPTVQARIEREHETLTDGRCAYMHQHGITEPFYTLAEVALIRAGGLDLPLSTAPGIHRTVSTRFGLITHPYKGGTMYNPYLAEATALLAEAAQELPEDATAAAAIKATMAQAYATLSLAQEVAAATAVRTSTTNTYFSPSPPCN